jgi:hypothetical protein
MLGRLLNTLRYRLNCDFDEWRKANPVLREYAWSSLQRILIAAGTRPVRSPLVLCISVLVLSAGLWGYYALTTLLSAKPPQPPARIEQHFFTLWTIQAGIVALIYPIVIGFVSLLLQRRHSAKASLHIYLHDSAAIVTGLSALFLVFTMGIQFFFLRMVGEPTVNGWLVLDVLWFLVNILGVIWFLVRTFDYLRPERRAKITRAYAINHILPKAIHRNLEYHLFREAINYGWLPGPSYGAAKDESNTAILPGPVVGRNMGDRQVTARQKGTWTIRDVRFRLLSLAIRSWQRREEKLARSSEAKPPSFFGMRHSRLLILPAVPGELFDPEVGLCRTQGGSGLRWWERWLVRWSFALSPATNTLSTLSISDLLNDLITEVQLAMQAGQEVVFREALRELVDLHAGLIQAGDFINDAGQRENYAALGDRNDIFEARMHDLWVREYRGLLDEVVTRLSVSAVYFDYMAYVAGRLISHLERIRPIRILSHLLDLPLLLHYRLNRWWAKTVEEQGQLHHGPCKPCTLNAPAFAVYEFAIKQFIEAWKSLKNDRFLPTRDDQLTWHGCSHYTELFTGHLDMTLYMLFDSVLLGNNEGAEWLCDGLIKWWSAIVFRFDDELYFIRDDRMLTLGLTDKPWEEARNAIDLSIAPMARSNEENSAQKALWAACMRNYWLDLCCVSLYAMIQLGKDCTYEKSLPARLVNAVIQGSALREGGEGIGIERPVRTIEDLLIAMIRQYYVDRGYHRGYRARLDEVVRRISEQGKPAMVPGRDYSRSGRDDLDVLRDGQLVLLCLFVKQGWSPSARLIETIQKWGTQDDTGLRAFVDLLKKWKTRLSEADFHVYHSLYSCVQSISDGANDFQDARTWLDAGIGQLIAGIEGFRLEQLRDTQVSDARLGEVARWSSQSGFNKDTADVPVTLFREVRHSGEEYDERSLIIRGMNKREFVEPGMAQRASNENEWFDHTVSSRVAGSVIADVLKALNPTIVDVASPSLYWQQLKIAAVEIRRAGGTPILFVAGRAEPRWLLHWTRSTYGERVSRPEDLRFVRDNQFDSKGYVGSLNDIPVYVAPVGAGSSYLLPKETLDVLSFTEFKDGVFVQVSYEPVEGQDALINLKLSWRFQVDLKSCESWQLRYISNIEA